MQKDIYWVRVRHNPENHEFEQSVVAYAVKAENEASYKLERCHTTYAPKWCMGIMSKSNIPGGMDGWADSKEQAETMAAEARNKIMAEAVKEIEALQTLVKEVEDSINLFPVQPA